MREDAGGTVLPDTAAQESGKKIVIGFDTSNYRTSVAAVTLQGEILLNQRKLLPVAMGERGLRQSDAVYAHLKQIKPMLDTLREVCQDHTPVAVCASTKPRAREDSYMPVFEVGETVGRGIAASMDIPFYETDHQHGHLRAAQHGTPLKGNSDFLALHLSGGTTDLLSLQGNELTELGTSLDLHAGQLVDRVGVALGLPFPSGPELEKLAMKGRSEARLGVSMTDHDLSCHLSGAESQAQRWIQQKALPVEDIAIEVYDLLARTIARMLTAGQKRTNQKAALICGGIASSNLFRKMLEERLKKQRSTLQIVFGSPELSGDNAVGVALIGRDCIAIDEYYDR